MEDQNEIQPHENREIGGESDQAASQKLDDATFEPQALIEQTGDYSQSEAIQNDFTTTVDNASRTPAREQLIQDSPADDGKTEATPVPMRVVENKILGVTISHLEPAGDTEGTGQDSGHGELESFSKTSGQITDDASVNDSEEISKTKKKQYKEKMISFLGVEWPSGEYEEILEEEASPKDSVHAGDAGKVNESVEITKKKKEKHYRDKTFNVFGVEVPTGEKEEILEEEARPKQPVDPSGHGKVEGVIQPKPPATLNAEVGKPSDSSDPGNAGESGKIGRRPKKYTKQDASTFIFGVEIPGSVREYTQEEAQPKQPVHAGEAGKVNEGVKPSSMKTESEEGRRDELPKDEKKEDVPEIRKKSE